jgi:predicted Fe-Mo cluster-binding NifX family protein
VRVSFGTRIAPDLKQRVKVYAAAMDQTIEDVVEAALAGYLPHVPARTSDVQQSPGAGTPGPLARNIPSPEGKAGD